MKWRVYFLLAAFWNWSAFEQQAVAQSISEVFSSVTAATKGHPLLRAPFVLVNNLPVVQVTVDGRTGNFILDTGAEVTLLNQHYFAGVSTAAPTGAGATGALSQTASYRASHFAWQDLILTDVTLTTTDLTQLGTTSLLGLLGADLLTHYTVTLNYTDQIITLRVCGALPLPPPLLTLPFTRRGHLPVMVVTIANQSYDVAIDSGASVNMLTETLLPILKNDLSNLATSLLSGAAAQQRLVTRGALRLATLGHQLPLRDMATVFMTIRPLARSQPTPIMGIMGYEFLRQYQVTINYPKGVIEIR